VTRFISLGQFTIEASPHWKRMHARTDAPMKQKLWMPSKSMVFLNVHQSPLSGTVKRSRNLIAAIRDSKRGFKFRIFITELWFERSFFKIAESNMSLITPDFSMYYFMLSFLTLSRQELYFPDAEVGNHWTTCDVIIFDVIIFDRKGIKGRR